MQFHLQGEKSAQGASQLAHGSKAIHLRILLRELLPLVNTKNASTKAHKSRQVKIKFFQCSQEVEFSFLLGLNVKFVASAL